MAPKRRKKASPGLHRNRKSGRPRLSEDTRREKQIGVRFRPDEMAILEDLLRLDPSGTVKIASLVRDAAVEHAVRALQEVQRFRTAQAQLEERARKSGEREAATLRLQIDGARQQERVAAMHALYPRAFGVMVDSEGVKVMAGPAPILPRGIGPDGRLQGSEEKGRKS